MFAVYPLDAEARSVARRKARASVESYECHVCKRSFTKQYNLLIHQRAAHKGAGEGDVANACDICGKVFKNVEAMKCHR